jgi:hypothetical protein
VDRPLTIANSAPGNQFEVVSLAVQVIAVNESDTEARWYCSHGSIVSPHVGLGVGATSITLRTIPGDMCNCDVRPCVTASVSGSCELSGVGVWRLRFARVLLNEGAPSWDRTQDEPLYLSVPRYGTVASLGTCPALYVSCTAL